MPATRYGKKMRLLADVNMLAEAVSQLRAAGHDVLWAKESNAESSDLELLRQATREQRTLFSYDTDYGELVRLNGEPAPYGVIQFRIRRNVPIEVQAVFISSTIAIWEPWPPGIWTIQIRHNPG